MDRAFVAIVNKYYKTGKADWLDEEKLAKIIEGSDKKSKTLCGEVAPNIILPDVTGEEWINMHDIEAEYLVIAIWEPGCGHCKKEMPKLQEVYKQFKSKGLEIVAVNNELENEDWAKFVEEKELDWINISDNPEINNSENARQLILDGTTTLNSLNFRAMYNITSTPQIYLLDKKKEIIAKQLNSEQLEGMLKSLLNDPIDSKSNEALDEGIINEDDTSKKKKVKG
jgi:thiol-disulfide isomerase/thioredoxin